MYVNCFVLNIFVFRYTRVYEQRKLVPIEKCSDQNCRMNRFTGAFCRAFKVQQPRESLPSRCRVEKKHANAAMYCARRQKKAIEKKDLIAGTNFFSRHRHLRAESFASFIKSDLSFSHWVTSNRPWKYARRYSTPRENTSRREKNFVRHKEWRERQEKGQRNKKTKELEERKRNHIVKDVQKLVDVSSFLFYHQNSFVRSFVIRSM